MRRVEYFKWKMNDNGTFVRDENQHLIKENKGEATFHQFGLGYEEFEAGPGNYTTAILELDDGSVISVDAEMIRFIDGSGRNHVSLEKYKKDILMLTSLLRFHPKEYEGPCVCGDCRSILAQDIDNI